jgi:putative membrane protein
MLSESSEPPHDPNVPPPLPPIIPPATPPPVPPPIPSQAPTGSVIPEQRLHSLSLLFIAWDVVRGWLIPIIFLLIIGRFTAFYGFLLILIIPQVLISVARYFSFTYRLVNGELITRQGILEKNERHIPIERVQDVRIEQGVLHRFFRVASVQVETASGQGAEASLSVLLLSDAEQLREIILQSKAVQAVPQPGAIEPTPEPVLLRSLSMRELVLAGLTSNRMASFLALVGGLWAMANQFFPEELHRQVAHWIATGIEHLDENGPPRLMLFVIGISGMLLVSMILSTIGSVVLFYGFTLSRQGEDLHRSYGLLTRRTSSFPRRRIQVLQVQESLFRRLFKLATLRADTAGGPAEQEGQRSGRDVLLPVIRREEILPLIGVCLPDFDEDPAEWKRVSRLAIRRGTRKGLLALLLLALLVALPWRQAGFSIWAMEPHEINLDAFWLLALAPLVYLVNWLSYKHTGYALGQNYFRTRRGWMNRSTHVVPIRNVQSVVLRQTPFDRRLRLATLTVDTAGQTYTGGGPRIRNIPVEKALVVAHELAHGAARRRYRW